MKALRSMCDVASVGVLALLGACYPDFGFHELEINGSDIRDDSNHLVAQPDVEDRPILHPGLEALIHQSTDPQKQIPVILALRTSEIVLEEPAEIGSAFIAPNGEASIVLNGETISNEHFLEYDRARRQHRQQFWQALDDDQRLILGELLHRYPELSQYPSVVEAMEAGRASVEVPMAVGEIYELAANNPDLVVRVEQALRAKDTLSMAMISTRVTPWAIPVAGATGQGIGIFQAEPGCPDIGLPNYYKISGNFSQHAGQVAAVIQGVSPAVYLYCRAGSSGNLLPTTTDLNGYNGNPQVFVENHSWAEEYSQSSDSYRVTDRDHDNHVYNKKMAVFIAAGNDSNYSASPGKARNVFTVGNYDDSNNQINNSSSYRNPETGNEKPEIVAPGTSISVTVKFPGGNDYPTVATGTSFASPHAAGFAADLMSSYDFLKNRPHVLKAMMLAGADNPIGGGTDKVGVGGLDFYSTYYNGYIYWYEGNNSYFTSNGDYDANSGCINKYIYLDASNYTRAAISWLTRGTYTYSNPSTIGMNLDLWVYAPDGSLVGSSNTSNNAYELLNFNPQTSGNYRFCIKRSSNFDTQNNLRLGLYVNWEYGPLEKIKFRSNSNKCLHKKDDNWNNGNPIHLWDCSAGPDGNKHWIYYNNMISAQYNSNKCLHKKDDNWNNGNPIHLWDCSAGPSRNKTWIYDGNTGYIHAAENMNKCIHKKDGNWNNGNPIHLWDCSAGPSENKTFNLIQ